MKEIKKILACVDLSEYSFMTLEYALALAGQTGAQIIVLNVINQRDIHAVEMAGKVYPLKQNVDTYIRGVTQIRSQGLRQLIRDNFFEEKSNMILKIETGIPYEVIIDTAESENADLIVMANKGRSNLSRVFFGSAAEKVFRHSKVPVVSVRDKKIFKRGQ